MRVGTGKEQELRRIPPQEMTMRRMTTVRLSYLPCYLNTVTPRKSGQNRSEPHTHTYTHELEEFRSLQEAKEKVDLVQV
jgi:hypothetical protein